jgi:3-oxoacyl-[acyl-carrier protein] reductase
MTNSVTKTAIVTGASGGIGGSVAKRLAKDRFAVVVNYAGNATPAQSIVEEIEAAGGQGIAVQADVANAEDVERLFNESMDIFGEPDVVVHCAAIMPLFPISGGDLATFEKVIATNLTGTFLVFAQAAQYVPDGGRIIAFSSSVLAKSFPGYGAYIASKAGVEGLVHVLANELRGRNISVNAVAPGPVGTDLFLKGKNAEQIDQFKKMSPLERLGMPLDIANLVSFLAGPEGGWMNSQILHANGGFA